MCDACGYSHPVGEITGVDVMTAGSKKHLSLCGYHATPLLQLLANEAGAHPALMEILKKKEDRTERQAVARGERATLPDVARERGFESRP